MAARGARAAGRFSSADRRADRLYGDRSGCAVLARGVSGRAARQSDVAAQRSD